MKKALLLTALLVGGLLFTSNQGVSVAASTDLPQATPYVESLNELVEDEINIPTVEVVDTMNTLEEVPTQDTNPCPYGHENCDGNHTECGKGHVDCAIDHSLCTQNHENCDVTHQGQHQGGRGNHQGNAQGNRQGRGQGNGCHSIQE